MMVIFVDTQPKKENSCQVSLLWSKWCARQTTQQPTMSGRGLRMLQMTRMPSTTRSVLVLSKVVGTQKCITQCDMLSVGLLTVYDFTKHNGSFCALCLCALGVSENTMVHSVWLQKHNGSLCALGIVVQFALILFSIDRSHSSQAQSQQAWTKVIVHQCDTHTGSSPCCGQQQDLQAIP